MKQVCYFETLLNLELFEQILTQDGDIALSRIDRDMSDSEVDKVMSSIHGYHTRGNPKSDTQAIYH